MNDIAEALIGKTITAYDIEEAGDYIRFTMKDGSTVTLITYSEYSTHTWIESLDAPDALLGRVQDVEDINMPDLGDIDGTRYKCVDRVTYYGLKITTNKGRCVIDYRNDNNWYYGGSLFVGKEA